MAEPDIPAEAMAAARNIPEADYEQVIRAAAPHIARAARIAEIRAIADWLDAEADKAMLDSDQREYAADRLRERADEMEADNA